MPLPRHRTFRPLHALAFVVLFATHATQPARAASATWNGGSDTLWATPGNWSASPVPGSGDTATFNHAGGSTGTVKLTKSGAGTLALSGTASTFSGGTSVGAASGIVTAQSTGGTNATGLGSGAVSVGADSTLNLLSVNRSPPRAELHPVQTLNFS